MSNPLHVDANPLRLSATPCRELLRNCRGGVEGYAATLYTRTPRTYLQNAISVEGVDTYSETLRERVGRTAYSVTMAQPSTPSTPVSNVGDEV